MRMKPVLATLLAATVVHAVGQAAADPWKDESGNGRYEREYRYKEERGRDEHGYKYQWQDGNCKYSYRSDRRGYKEERKCRNGGHYAGGPPPWAPAYGYYGHHYDRHYHKRYNKHAYKRRYEHERYDDRYERERYAAYQVPYGLDLGHCNRAVLGGVLGGAAGAALGSRVDRHDGRTAAIVGGTIIGVLVGGAIGQYMDSVDQNCIGQTLEHVPDGETIVWQNPNVGGAYQVTPAETYQRDDGRYCREYVTEVVVGGRRQQAYGTACRQPDGSWKVSRS